MVSNDETVAEAIAAERHHIECAKADAEDLEIECEFTDEEVVAIIDRIEAAHMREVTLQNKRLERVVEDSNRTCGLCEPSKKILELRECLKETINVAADDMWWKRGCDKTKNVCTNCKESDKTFPCPVKRWRKALG